MLLNLCIIWSYYSFYIIGNKEHLIGAILGGKATYVLFSSLILKFCSKTLAITLPIPKAGSMAYGINFSSIWFFSYYVVLEIISLVKVNF